jgi:hypothetical protein
VISKQEEEVVIDGLSGRWTFIGSDIGRGWVFDAYVSPVRVFEKGETISGYAERALILKDTIAYTDTGGNRFGMTIQRDSRENQFVLHQFYEGYALELRISELSESQAKVIFHNWMLAKEFSQKTVDLMLTDLGWTKFDESGLQHDGMYLILTYNGSTLSIYREGDDTGYGE